MLEIVLTREDANTEYALLAEWLVEDRVGGGGGAARLRRRDDEGDGRGRGARRRDDRAALRARTSRSSSARRSRTSRRRRTSSRRSTRRAEEKPAPKPAAGDRKATRKAVELAELHGIDLASIEKRGFITEKDVEALIAAQKSSSAPAAGPILAGVSTDGVSLPATFELDEDAGALDPAFLESSLDHDAFRALAPAEKVTALRDAGAQIGDGVDLGEGSLVVAPRIVIEDGVRLGPRATIVCEEVVAIGELSQFGADLELRCRRAFLGAGIWGGRSVRFGGGGHRDPWATLAIGDLAFVGDEAFVNVCRPVLIGREVFLTMRSIIVTHNIGHSVLEGFENRFAPVVLEDRSQVGLGAVLYAGCAGRRRGDRRVELVRRRRDSRRARSRSAFPRRRRAARATSSPTRAELDLARRMIDDLHELLALRGHAVSAIEDDGFEIEGTRVTFTESYRGGVDAPAVVLALDVRGDVPGRRRGHRPRSAAACTGAGASCSTRCASSAASAGSSSSRGRGATRAASSEGVVGITLVFRVSRY